MASITARKLSRNTASVIDELVDTGEPVMIVRNGQPVAVLSAVDPAHVEDAVLSAAPEFTEVLAEADAAAAAGETSTFEEIFAEGEDDVEQGGDQDPVAGGEYETKLDPVVLDDLVGTVVGHVAFGAVRSAEEIPPERLLRIQEISVSLAKRLLARNIDQTVEMVDVLSTSMIGAGAADDDRFDEMIDKLDESAGLASTESG
ncbi:MAG: Antitoxin Phd YefM, type toxin-antitoxin system [Solirubrobacterales bacterium]|jgi:prevent-host-death family protein|nr:Antitoxin Phd YefM, type toxin-antitoxin system [Solirubrobacterales bacterium]